MGVGVVESAGGMMMWSVELNVHGNVKKLFSRFVKSVGQFLKLDCELAVKNVYVASSSSIIIYAHYFSLRRRGRKYPGSIYVDCICRGDCSPCKDAVHNAAHKLDANELDPREKPIAGETIHLFVFNPQTIQSLFSLFSNAKIPVIEWTENNTRLFPYTTTLTVGIGNVSLCDIIRAVSQTQPEGVSVNIEAIPKKVVNDD